MVYNQRLFGAIPALNTAGRTHQSKTSSGSLFEEINQEDLLIRAVDEINERYGTFVIHSADTLKGKRIVKQKVPFGSTNYFDLLLR